MRTNAGDIEAHIGAITGRTASIPSLRAAIKYSAQAVSGAGESWFAATQYPLNLTIPLTDTRMKLIPAKVGDPCLLVRIGGVAKIVTLTELIQTGAC